MNRINTMEKRRPAQQEQALTHQEDELLTPSEVGRRLGKTHTTIMRWIEDGLLEAIELPSGLRAVRASQVNAILNGSQITGRV